MNTKTTAAKPFVMLDAAGIDKAIVSIGKAGAKLDALIQQTAVSALDHLDKHSDITLVNRLQVSMPKGSRQNALTAFLLACGKIKVRQVPAMASKAAKEALKASPFEFDREGKTDLEKAMANPWYEFKKPKDISVEFGTTQLKADILRLVLKVDKALVDSTSGLAANDPLVQQLKALSKLAAQG